MSNSKRAALPQKPNNRRQRQQGNVMVESALILLAFLVILIGIVDFGQFLFIHSSLSERARLAARWGAVNYNTSGFDATGIQNMVLYNQPTVPTGTPTPPTYFRLQPSMVQVSHTGAGTDDERIVLTISRYPYDVLSPMISGRYQGPKIVSAMPLGLN